MSLCVLGYTLYKVSSAQPASITGAIVQALLLLTLLYCSCCYILLFFLFTITL